MGRARSLETMGEQRVFQRTMDDLDREPDAPQPPPADADAFWREALDDVD